MKAYLHVGAHKTGTTALQKALRKSNKNIITPAVYRNSEVDIGYQKGNDVVDIFIENFAHDGVLAISEERLLGQPFRNKKFYRKIDNLGRLISKLRDIGWEVHVLLVIRKYYPFLHSWYKQCVGAGACSKGFLDYMKGELPENYDWGFVIDNISKSGGEIVVLPYEKMLEDPAEFVVDVNNFFVGLCELQAKDIEHRRNRSLDANGIEIMRLLSNTPKEVKEYIRPLVHAKFKDGRGAEFLNSNLENLLIDGFEKRDLAGQRYLREADKKYWTT